MKVEHIDMYGHFDQYIPHCYNLDEEFSSIYQVACVYRERLLKSNGYVRCIMLWLDNTRYILVTKDAYDVNYHAFFNN